MTAWVIVFSKTAEKDAKKWAMAGLKPQAQALLTELELDPLQNPPPYKKLLGDLTGTYSCSINSHHRLVYQVFPAQCTIRILRMWIHHE